MLCISHKSVAFINHEMSCKSKYITYFHSSSLRFINYNVAVDFIVRTMYDQICAWAHFINDFTILGFNQLTPGDQNLQKTIHRWDGRYIQMPYLQWAWGQSVRRAWSSWPCSPSWPGLPWWGPGTRPDRTPAAGTQWTSRSRSNSQTPTP